MSADVVHLASHSKRAPIELTMSQFLAMRQSEYQRSDFLESLGYYAKPQITTIITNALGHTPRAHLLINGEAKQAFLIAANAAIDSARTEDDGRGKNDPVKWCVWRGLNNVRELLRDVHCRRADMPSKKQQFESRIVYQSQLEEAGGFTVGRTNGISGPGQHSGEVFSNVLAQRGHYVSPSSEEEMLLSVLLDEIVTLCSTEEHQVFELLVLGHTGELELLCGCAGRKRHSLTTDLAKTLGKTDSQIRRIRANLENKVRGLIVR